MINYLIAVSALVLIFVEPFVSIAGTLPCIGFHKAISNIASITVLRVHTVEASNNRWAWILDALSSFRVVVLGALGASIICIAVDTVIVVFAAKRTALTLQVKSIGAFGALCFACALQTVV